MISVKVKLCKNIGKIIIEFIKILLFQFLKLKIFEVFTFRKMKLVIIEKVISVKNHISSEFGATKKSKFQKIKLSKIIHLDSIFSHTKIAEIVKIKP